MNMVDLRRTRSRSAACAAVATFAMLGTYQASAEVANPNLVPVGSAIIVSVPDAPAAWNAWEANGLYGAYKKIMAKPDMETKVAGFSKELSIVETSLGFKLDGPTLSKVFSAVSIYMEPADESNSSNIAGIFKISDQDKLNKLLDLAEKAAAQSVSSDDETSSSKDADDSKTSTIAESDYHGVKMKTFKPGDDSAKIIYAQAGGFFVVGSQDKLVHEAIDRIKATAPGAGTVSQSEEFKKIDAALAAEKGEIYVYGNQELATKMQGNNNMPEGLMAPLKSLMNNMAPLTYYGASIKIAPKEIASYSYGLIREGSTNSLLLKNPGDKPLNVLSYVPESTMLAIGTSLFDAPSLYKVAAGVADQAGANLDDRMKNAEVAVGFSVKNDLLPALGNEIGFALNSVKFEGLLPQVDATIMLGVKDKARMQKVVDGTERLVTNIMASKAEDGETSSTGFQKVKVDGNTINYLESTGMAGMTPGFVLTDNYLFIGSSKASLQNALTASSSGKNLVTGSALKDLGHTISASANVVQYASFSSMLDVAQQVISALPAAQGAADYIEAAKVIDSAGSVSRVENGAAVGHGVLKLK